MKIETVLIFVSVILLSSCASHNPTFKESSSETTQTETQTAQKETTVIKYTVSYSENSDFAISGLKNEGYEAGETVTFSVEVMNPTKELDIVTVDNTQLFTSNGAYTFDMPTKNVIINVILSEKRLPTDDPTSEIKIKFWHCLGHAKTRTLEKIADKFNETYAGKYKIYLFKIAGGYDDLADSIKTKTKAGEIPALAMGYPDSFANYMTTDIHNSALYRLDNFISDPEYGYSEAELADFVPGFLEEGKCYQFEGTWSMPMYKSTELMCYNASYMAGANPQNDKKFDKVSEYINLSNAANDPLATDEQLEALTTWVKAHEGYTYNVPVTWSEMFATARQIKADMASQGLGEKEFFPVVYDSHANMFISQFAQRGIDYTAVGDSSDPSTQYLFNNDQAKAFLTEVVGYVRDKLLNSNGGYQYTYKYFNSLKSAMCIGFTGGFSHNISANFRVKLAPVPYADGKQPKYIQQGPSICFFNNDDPYIHKGAWLFYKLLADPTYNAELALENFYEPVRQSSFETKIYKYWIAKHDVDLKYDILYHTKDLTDKYMVTPAFVGSDTARSEMEKLVGKVVDSNYSIDEALKTAYDACLFLR